MDHRLARRCLFGISLLLLVAVSVAAPASSGAPAQPIVTRLSMPLAARGVRLSDLRGPTALRPTATAGSPTVPTPTPTVPPAASPTAPPPSPSPTPGAWPCRVIPTFEEGHQPLVELFVATTGSDTAGDGSADRPFATIGRAARQARPGTAIRIQPGSYPGGHYVEGLRGTVDAPIWLGGVPGAVKPIIGGGGEGLHLTRVSYVVIHDLVVQGAGANGVNIDDGGDYANPEASHHVLVRDLFIDHIGAGGNQDCLKLSGVHDVQVLDSSFESCGGGGSAIDMVGVHHALIARNMFRDLGSNAVQAKGGSSDIEIRGNSMENAGGRAVNMGGSTGFEYFRPPLSASAPNAEARNVRVLANVIVGSQAPVAFVGCVDCLVANNTIVDPERWVMRILQETVGGGGFAFEPARGGRFVNNLVFFNRGRLATTVNIGPNTAPETFSFAHNLWYAHDDPARSRPDLPAAEQGAVIGLDPLFVGSFVIQANSPAAGAGLSLPEVRADLGGACYRDPPSIGAFEVP